MDVVTGRSVVLAQTAHQATAEVMEHRVRVDVDDFETWAEVAVTGPDGHVSHNMADSFEQAIADLQSYGFVVLEAAAAVPQPTREDG